jgi:hypothetical protein
MVGSDLRCECAGRIRKKTPVVFMVEHCNAGPSESDGIGQMECVFIRVRLRTCGSRAM